MPSLGRMNMIMSSAVAEGGSASFVLVCPELPGLVSAHSFCHRAVDKCEVLLKDVYVNLGLEYRDNDSEEDNASSKPMEVIEIPDEDDDDVMSVDSG